MNFYKFAVICTLSLFISSISMAMNKDILLSKEYMDRCIESVKENDKNNTIDNPSLYCGCLSKYLTDKISDDTWDKLYKYSQGGESTKQQALKVAKQIETAAMEGAQYCIKKTQKVKDK